MARTKDEIWTRLARNGTLIFITVGTTLPFDELLAEADRLAASGVITEPLVCQGGTSLYRMLHGEQFVGAPSLDGYYEQASLVVCHGGGGTVLELLISGKPFVAFPNTRGAGDHQSSFLRQVSKIADISWSSAVSDLQRLIEERRARGPSRIEVSIPKAAGLIEDFLSS